jgi:glycosyltransferase involved in cell wall biosynthesis
MEGFGLVAVEAAACGTVVIAADHSGLAEAVTPEIGFLVEPGNAAAWASRIQTIRVWSEEERQGFIACSCDAARRTYSWERVARETTELYRQAQASA